jgi:hypothetical protein
MIAGHSNSSSSNMMAVHPSVSKEYVSSCSSYLVPQYLPVPFLSYTALTFNKSTIPPHTSAHKHGRKKDISASCNEGEHHEPHYVMVVNGKCSSPHCSHKVGI